MKVLYITNGLASSLHSSFELCCRLKRAGHEVAYLSPADVGEAVRAQGHGFERLSEDRERLARAAEEPSLWSTLPDPRAALRWLRRRHGLRQESLASQEIERAVRRHGPELLLIDIEMHYAVVATASLGLPTLLAMVFFTVFRRPGLPPLHRDLPPGGGRLGRLRLGLAWWRLRAETLHMEWRQRYERLRRGEVLPPVAYDTVDAGELRALARRRGFPLRRETSRAHWLRPWVYRRLPILCLNAFEMELPHEPPANLYYVGPMVHRERGEARLEPASAAAWRSFRERHQGSGRPLVYCSLGSYWTADEAFLGEVLALFARRRDWDLVLGLGGKLSPEALGPVPGNALVLPWAPQLEVLAEADCAVVHGGVATLQECAVLEVPMVVCSTGHVEQNGNAVRIAHHGLGVVAGTGEGSLVGLERAIERVLADPSFQRALGTLGERLRAYEAPEKVAALFEAAAQGAL